MRLEPISHNVRHFRKLLGMTQAELAKAAGTTQYTVSEIELAHREPHPATLRKLAAALGVRVADFYGEPHSPLAEAPPSSIQPPLTGFEEERRSLTAYERNAADALDAFCSQLEEFLTVFLPENDGTPLGENLLNMQRYMARTAAALSLPYMESATMRPVMLPAATRFVELVRALEEAAKNSGAGADEETDNVIHAFEGLALAS
jgi:transcriptional regulator with XRE-family HTH domain